MHANIDTHVACPLASNRQRRNLSGRYRSGGGIASTGSSPVRPGKSSGLPPRLIVSAGSLLPLQRGNGIQTGRLVGRLEPEEDTDDR